MGEILHKKGDRKNIREKILNEIYCSTVKDKLSIIANLSKKLTPRTYIQPLIMCLFSSDKLQI